MSKLNRFRFRAWDKTRKSMVGGRGTYPDWDARITFDGVTCEIEGDFCEYRPEWILMQSTGLTDKNAVEIFEGDILRTLVTQSPCDQYCLETVVWSNGGFMLEHPEISKLTPVAWPSHLAIEVIGNIHQNPELLEPSHAPRK